MWRVLRNACSICVVIVGCAGHEGSAFREIAALRPSIAPAERGAPPPFFLLDARPGLEGQINVGWTAKLWLGNRGNGIAGHFLRPFSSGGRTIVTDGVAFGRVWRGLVSWAPELSCGLEPRDRLAPIWGRDPELFAIAHDGFVRFDSARRRWVRVGPDARHWPGDPAVTELSDQKSVLVLWLPRNAVADVGGRANVRAFPDPERVAPGFYRLTDALEPVGLQLRPRLDSQNVVDFAVTSAGDVVLLSTAGADIWRSGQTQSISTELFTRTLPEAFSSESNWIDVDGPRAPEVIHRAPRDHTQITRFDGKTWSSVDVPFAGPISVWARDGSARLYAEQTDSGARIWRRTSDDRFSRLQELPDGNITALASDPAGAIWAFSSPMTSLDGVLWYLPRANEPVRVPMPGKHGGPQIADFTMIDLVAWVSAVGPDVGMWTFTSEKFVQVGTRIRPGVAPCTL